MLLMSLLQPAHFLMPPAILLTTRGEVTGGLSGLSLLQMAIFVGSTCSTERWLIDWSISIILWKVGWTRTCAYWSLSWGNFPTHSLWGSVCCKVITVSARITFKEARKPIFVLGNCQSMKTQVVSGKKWASACRFTTLETNYFMWNSSTTIHKETAILGALSEVPIGY